MTRSSLATLTIGIALLTLATTGAHLYSIDGLEYYRVADRLVFAGRLDFDPPLLWGEPISTAYTPIGFSLALIPAVILALPVRHLQPVFPPTDYDYGLLYNDPMAVGIGWVNPLLVGLAAAMTAVLVTRLGGSARLGVVAGVVASVASPLFFYGRSDMSQALMTFLLTATLVAAIDARRTRSGWVGVALVALLAAGVLTRPVDGMLAAVVAVVVVAWPASSSGDRPARDSIVAIVAGVAIGLAGDGLVNYLRWGHPLEFGYPSGFHGSLWPGLAAELFSPGRGIAWYLPLSLLSLPGIVRTIRGGRIPDSVGILAAVGSTLVAYALWQGLGGWSWGPRYLVPLVPMLVALAALAARGLLWKTVFGLLAIAGILANTGHLAVDQLRIVWPIYGDSVFGTAGFDLQSRLESYGPIASWARYKGGSDVALLEAADATSGWSVVALAAMLIGAAALITFAVWRARSSDAQGMALPTAA